MDGSGSLPYRSDLLIKEDTISAIGSFPSQKADQVINGLGYTLTPGFIDVNTDSDHLLSLFTYPSQQDFLLQGVTTIIGGHCGASLAPLLYGTLESIRKWTDTNQINVDWHTVAEFFKTLSGFKIGVNFGTLVGHSTIRRAIINNDLRDLTTSELEVFEKIVKQSMEEGALGLSTGLGYVHARNTPYSEIARLTKIVARYNGVYATHLRDEQAGLVAAVNETIKIAKENKVKTLISHFKPILGFENQYQTALDMLDAANEQVDIHFDSYPYSSSIVPIYTLLPTWAQNGGLEIMLENIQTSHIRERILEELPKLNGESMTISQAPGAEFLAGKTLGQYAADYELPIKEALLQLMSVSKLRAIVFLKNINETLMLKALMRDPALVASNSASVSDESRIIKHERSLRTFPKFLSLAAEKNILPMELAVKKITATPAAKFNIKNRGLIKQGLKADLVLLKNNKPEYVLVNGQLAVKEGKYQGALAGRIIKRPQ